MSVSGEPDDREVTGREPQVRPHGGLWARADLLAVLLFLLVLGRCSQRMYIGCPDFFWHVKTGERIVRERHIIWRDDFSHTANGRIGLPQDWLFQAGEYLLYAHLGLSGVMLGMAVLAAAGATLFYWMLRHSLRMSVVLALIAAWLFWSVWAGDVEQLRPKVFQALGLLIVLLALVNWSRGRYRTMLWLPPFFVLWANVHGSFVYGLAVCIWFLATEAGRWWLRQRRDGGARRRLKSLSLYVGACAVATFVSAATYHTYVSAFRFIRFRMEWDRHIFEWQSWQPDAHGLGGAILVGLLAALCLGRRPVSMFWAVLLGGTFWYALTHRRFVSMFAVVALPLVAVQLQSWIVHLDDTVSRVGPWARLRQWLRSTLLAPGLADTSLYAAVAPVLILAAALAVLPSLPHGRTLRNSTTPGDYPFVIADTVWRYDIPGKMLNKYADGGFLLFRLWPKQRVFVDGRSLLYRDRICLDASAAIDGKENWRQLFEQYGITFVITPDDAGIVKKLEADPEWVRVQRAEEHRLYLKRCKLNEPVLARLRADGIWRPGMTDAPDAGSAVERAP